MFGKTGDKHHSWRGGISYGQYCPKFNEKVKEYIRDKYYRKCFLCNMEEKYNGRKLDVHHIDYNKDQGCGGHKWQLVPLCRSCHTRTNSNREMYERRIRIMLEVCGYNSYGLEEEDEYFLNRKKREGIYYSIKKKEVS